jgi:hypothetical protein
VTARVDRFGERAYLNQKFHYAIGAVA